MKISSSLKKGKFQINLAVLSKLPFVYESSADLVKTQICPGVIQGVPKSLHF